MIVVPPDVDLMPDAAAWPPRSHSASLQALLDALPRELLGEAIAAELPEGTRLTLEVATEHGFDSEPGRVSIDFTFGDEWVELRGRVLHDGERFRLNVEPSYSLPVARG